MDSLAARISNGYELFVLSYGTLFIHNIENLNECLIFDFNPKRHLPINTS